MPVTKKQEKKNKPSTISSKKVVLSKEYIQAVGRRKTSTAIARLFLGKKDFVVNTKRHNHYFPTTEMQKIVEEPLKKVEVFGRFAVSILVSGGGIHSQAEAVRHAVSRALVKHDPEFRESLKRAGFLKRDPRMKERRKFGLKKARRAPQWSKR